MSEIKVGQTIAYRKNGRGEPVVMKVACAEKVSETTTNVKGTGIRLTGLAFLATFYVLIDSTADIIQIVPE